MSDPDLEPDPGRRAPTALWWILGVVLVVLFAVVVVMIGGHVFAPRSVGPPAGQP
jgi:hypothetical protein